MQQLLIHERNRALRAIYAVVVLSLLPRLALPQSRAQRIVTVEGDIVVKHRLSPRPIIHQELPHKYSELSVILYVVVNPSAGLSLRKPRLR